MNQTPAERKATLVSVGLPEEVADFVKSLDAGIAAGTLEFVSLDLEKILADNGSPLPAQ